MLDVIKYFPNRIQKILYQNIGDECLEEIRIRVNNPIILKFSLQEKVLQYFVSQDEILNILQVICNNSIYSYQNQINQGFLTIKGGHRVGITGSVVSENNKIININYITTLNFRIANQILGASDKIVEYIFDFYSNNIFNTLIISAPGKGKTTILRDLIKKASDGINEYGFRGINVGVVDERNELGAVYRGIPQNDLGSRTDILSNLKKSVGLKMLIRSMAPQIVVADEIGGEDDVEAIMYAINSGVKGIFTAHGNSIEEIQKNPTLKKLIDNYVFERIIILDSRKKGEILEVLKLDNPNLLYVNNF